MKSINVYVYRKEKRRQKTYEYDLMTQVLEFNPS